jgi:hypothetical protein
MNILRVGLDTLVALTTWMLSNLLVTSKRRKLTDKNRPPAQSTVFFVGGLFLLSSLLSIYWTLDKCNLHTICSS